MKIELSPELTKKALEIGATHVTPNLGCFKKVDEQYIYCNYGFGWSEYDHWSKLEDEIDDGKVFEIDFAPPKLELLAEIERLKAALDNQWLPIKSAPKDGSKFLFLEEDGRIQVGRFYSEMGEKRQIYVCLTSTGRDFYPTLNPTHWMPLPPNTSK